VRTQSSLAISVDGDRWLLMNASPDIRQQILQTKILQPQANLRHTPIEAVLLTNGDVDHVAGLLTLRESQPFRIYGTAQTLSSLALSPVFGVLSPQFVSCLSIPLDHTFEPLPGLTAVLFAVPGKVPLWLETGERPITEMSDVTIGVSLKANNKRIIYVPGCAMITDDLRGRIQDADALLFDGTVLEDDELIRAGVGAKTGRRMGHVPINGEDGSISGLAGVAVGRRIFVHINNTNPVLVEGSIERRLVEQAGWMIAHDGMRVLP